MKPKDMLTELEAVAQCVEVKVSYESIASSVLRGGLCKVKGQFRVIIDKRLAPDERVTTLAESLARFDWNKMDTMPKEVRSLLHYYAVRQGRIVSEEATTRTAIAS